MDDIYSDDFNKYKELTYNFMVLTICPCCNKSINDIIELKNKPTKSKLLRELIDDIQIAKCKIYKNYNTEFEYLITSKSLKLFKKDEYFEQALNKNYNISLQEHILNIGIEPDFDIVLLNFMDILGYIMHGSSFKYTYMTYWHKEEYCLMKKD